MTYVIEWPDGRREPVTLGERLGSSGSQGDVRGVVGRSALAAKLLHNPGRYQLDRRLALMIGHPPPATTVERGGITRVTWPTGILVHEEKAAVVGYVMPRLDPGRYVPLGDVFAQRFRDQILPKVTWSWYVQVALSLADLVADVHAHGSVIGDLAPANIFVTARGQAALVDVDGWQVGSGDSVLPCPFSRPEYTAPELLDQPNVRRRVTSDHWGLAALVVMLLTIGVHPFAGIAPTGRPPFDELANVRARRSWLLGDRMRRPAWAPDVDMLPGLARELFAQAFQGGYGDPDRRPSAPRWVAALSQVQHRDAITTCADHRRHVYPRELSVCPWCAIALRSGTDRFPERTR